MESQKQFKRRFSFEFFPPKTDQGKEKLQAVRNQLAEVNPDFSRSPSAPAAPPGTAPLKRY